jgi:hypothetical protein
MLRDDAPSQIFPLFKEQKKVVQAVNPERVTIA